MLLHSWVLSFNLSDVIFLSVSSFFFNALHFGPLVLFDVLFFVLIFLHRDCLPPASCKESFGKLSFAVCQCTINAPLMSTISTEISQRNWKFSKKKCLALMKCTFSVYLSQLKVGGV